MEIQKEVVVINGRELKQTVDTNSTAHEVIKMLANRERFRRFTDIGRVKFLMSQEGIKLDDDQYLECFKKLESKGLGSIIYGRNGKRDRFEWYYNLKSIGKAILSGSDEEAELVESISKEKGKTFNRAKLALVLNTKPVEQNPRMVEKASTALAIPLKSMDIKSIDETIAELTALKATIEKYSHA